jgi:hypothetical protein
MNKSHSLIFTGDFCPQFRVAKLIDQARFSDIFTDFSDIIKDCTTAIVDLECPLTDRESPIIKTGPNLRCAPKSVEALRFARVGAVAMANNHILDHGLSELEYTISTCINAGISTLGAGMNLKEASAPLLIRAGDMTVSCYNITENEWCCASQERGGANPLDLPRNFRDIQNALTVSDRVFVVYHGGNEFNPLPSPRLKDTLRFFIDAGASAVIAHHTHVVSGYELYKNRPIFYGLGNFCFDWPGRSDTHWTTGLAVKIYIHDPSRFELFPFKQNDERPGIRTLSPSENTSFTSQLAHLNDIINNDCLLEKRFRDWCSAHNRQQEIYLEPYRGGILALLRRSRLIPPVLGRRKRRFLLNLIRCESHRDMLLRYLFSQVK